MVNVVLNDKQDNQDGIVWIKIGQEGSGDLLD